MSTEHTESVGEIVKAAKRVGYTLAMVHAIGVLKVKAEQHKYGSALLAGISAELEALSKENAE